MSSISTHIALLISIFALIFSGTALGSAGEFRFVYGDVNVTSDDGRSRPAQKGMQVEEGDTITTAKGTAQLRMKDGAAIAVRPATELRVDEYSYQEQKEERSFFSLLRGTFRSITGAIGRNNRSSYRVSTATATIGIRGSDADIGHDPASGVTAVRTYSGGHTITSRNPTGQPLTLNTNPGQIAIARPGQGPTYSNTFPFANSIPPAPQQQQAQDGGQPQGQGSGQQQNNSDAGQRALAGDANPQQRQGSIPIAQRPGLETTVPLVCRSGGNACPQQRIARTGSAAVGAFAAVNTASNASMTPQSEENEQETIPSTQTIVANSGRVRVNGSVSSIFLRGDNAPIVITDPNDNGGFNFSAGNATLGSLVGFDIRNLDTGETVSRGRWGFWTGDFQVVEQGVTRTATSPFHFAVADQFTTTGQIQGLNGIGFSYQQIGGSATNETGAQASSFSVDINGTFSSDPSLGNVNVKVNASFPNGSTNWSLSQTEGSVANLAFNNPGLTLNVMCNSCANNTASGSASSVFLGSAAEGIITSIAGTDGTNSIVGTAVGQRIAITDQQTPIAEQ